MISRHSGNLDYQNGLVRKYQSISKSKRIIIHTVNSVLRFVIIPSISEWIVIISVNMLLTNEKLWANRPDKLLFILILASTQSEDNLKWLSLNFLWSCNSRSLQSAISVCKNTLRKSTLLSQFLISRFDFRITASWHLMQYSSTYFLFMSMYCWMSAELYKINNHKILSTK